MSPRLSRPLNASSIHRSRRGPIATAIAAALVLAGATQAQGQTAATKGPDLCAGLIGDTQPRPVSPTPKPAVGLPFQDPVFGSRVVRLTDVRAEHGKSVAKPLYATIPSWNADESKLLLWVRDKGHALYDGRSYRFIRFLDVTPADIEQLYWDPKDPDILWFLYVREQSGRSLRQLMRHDVNSGRNMVVHDFPDTGLPRAFKIDNGGDPQYPAWDLSLWGIRVSMPGAKEKFAFFLKDRSEGVRVRNADSTPQACPSGRCMWVPDDKGSHLVEPRSQQTFRKLKLWGDEHGNLGLSAAGDDFFAAVQFDGRHVGTLVVENVTTGDVKVVIGPSTGYPYPPTSTHVSAVAFKAPGWVAVSVVGRPPWRKTLEQELLLANVDSGKVCRVAHHHSHAKEGPSGYWGEPHVTISPSGTRLLFGSDWDGSDAVDTYVVETPAYKASPGAAQGR
jgi:hypothetical protein